MLGEHSKGCPQKPWEDLIQVDLKSWKIKKEDTMEEGHQQRCCEKCCRSIHPLFQRKKTLDQISNVHSNNLGILNDLFDIDYQLILSSKLYSAYFEDEKINSEVAGRRWHGIKTDLTFDFSRKFPFSGNN